MKKSATVLKNGFLKSYGALRTFMQNNPFNPQTGHAQPWSSNLIASAGSSLSPASSGLMWTGIFLVMVISGIRL
jgi:hypothetical protein